MDCIRCQIPLRRMALRTRPNHWDDHHPRAALRLIDTDDDTVYVTNPFDDLAFTQTHSALDAWVCPRCDQEQRRQQRDLEEYGADYFKTGRDHDTPEHHEPQQPEERAPDEWEHDGR